MFPSALGLSLAYSSNPVTLPVREFEALATLGSPPAAALDEQWTFSATPYLWLFGMDGDVRIANTTAEFDASFSDILDNLDIALMARVEAWKDGVGFYLDPLYGELEAEASSGAAQADIETELVIVDFGMLYRVFDQPTEKGRSRLADLSLGGRYIHLENDVDFDLAADRTGSTDTLDLTLGARYAMDFTDRFGFLVGGDLGGFDLGGSSTDFTWNAQALGSLRCGDTGRLWAGYRVLDVDDDKGGLDGVEVQFSGPVIGYEFRF
jgi:hypothetical protein